MINHLMVNLPETDGVFGSAYAPAYKSNVYVHILATVLHGTPVYIMTWCLS